MHEALLVKRGDRTGELAEHRHRIGELERSARQHARERLALEPLHREIGPAIGQLADRVDLHDGRVRDGLEAPGLGEELCAYALGANERGMDYL